MQILQALLGPEAKPGELNVLQVEAMGLKGPIKTPIALLEIGKTAQIILDLSFPDPPVTFTLVKGSGPVHIVGHNLLGKYILMLFIDKLSKAYPVVEIFIYGRYKYKWTPSNNHLERECENRLFYLNDNTLL